jgi:hypothetical protein
VLLFLAKFFKLRINIVKVCKILCDEKKMILSWFKPIKEIFAKSAKNTEPSPREKNLAGLEEAEHKWRKLGYSPDLEEENVQQIMGDIVHYSKALSSSDTGMALRSLNLISNFPVQDNSNLKKQVVLAMVGILYNRCGSAIEEFGHDETYRLALRLHNGVTDTLTIPGYVSATREINRPWWAQGAATKLSRIISDFRREEWDSTVESLKEHYPEHFRR